MIKESKMLMAHFFFYSNVKKSKQCKRKKWMEIPTPSSEGQAPSLSDTGRSMDGGKSTGLDPKEGGNRNRIALRCHYRYFCFYSTANPLSSLLGSCEKLKVRGRAKKDKELAAAGSM